MRKSIEIEPPHVGSYNGHDFYDALSGFGFFSAFGVLISGFLLTLFALMITAKLSGKTALITGASKGLGRAMALALAQAGARLVLVSRDLDQLNETAARIRQLSAEATVFQTDVSNEEQVMELGR